MVNIIDFFRNLPKKKCQQCGSDIDEKAECYGNICDECNHPAR